MLEVTPLGLSGVLAIALDRFEDERGWFEEAYNKRAFEGVGIVSEFTQDNLVHTVRTGTIRGLHFQLPPRPVAKLVRVISGAIFDVVVDLRIGSPTHGEHIAVELTGTAARAIFVPVGFAHGYCTTRPDTIVSYRVTDHWHPDLDGGVAWDDPDLGIQWPVDPREALVSGKDRHQPAFRDLPPIFEYGGA